MTTERPSKKLSNKYEGSFRICKIVSPHAYQLEIPSHWVCHDVFHTSLLRPTATDPLPGQIPPVPFPTVDEDGELSYDVDQILDCKRIHGDLKWLVQWTGYGINTWEPFKHVTTAAEAMDQFYARYPNKPGKQRWNDYQEGFDYNDINSDSSTD